MARAFLARHRAKIIMLGSELLGLETDEQPTIAAKRPSRFAFARQFSPCPEKVKRPTPCGAVACLRALGALADSLEGKITRFEKNPIRC